MKRALTWTVYTLLSGAVIAVSLTASGSGTPAATVNASGCHTGDPNHLCLAMKIVSYKDPNTESPVLTESQALHNLNAINSVWGQCNLGFEIEKYSAVDSTAAKLNFHTASYDDLDNIRNAFSESKDLLVVTTGPWDRTKSLGSTGANAWTALPGGAPYGAILEQPVGTFGNIVAHELGHYLNLSHLSDSSDLMNPIIYENSTNLTPDQCNTARSAASTYWASMQR